MNYYIILSLDIIVSILGLMAAFFVRNLISSIQPFSFYLPFLFFSAATTILSQLIYRIYGHKKSFFSLTYLINYLKAFCTWSFLLAVFAFFTKTDYSRLLVAIYILIVFSLGILLRLVVERFSNPSDLHKDKDIIDIVSKISHASTNSPVSLAFFDKFYSPEKNLLYFLTKRIFDIAAAFIGLIISLPFYPLIIYFIRRDSPGPAIIIQERIGRNGRKFLIYKFRTMKSDAKLYAEAPINPIDERITKVGSYLRKYSIDELPQFFNILRGEMSIVGPRPEMPFIVEKYRTWELSRLKAKPGLTGLWQILGRKDVLLADNLQYDFFYVTHQSFFLDIAIILRTIPHLFFPKGAY